MKNVILYCRVSTDEQADGCSLDYQERVLRAYCNNQQCNIIGIYHEEFSAKSHELNRPEFKKIYEYCKHHRNNVEKVLFLRWDRFTRNTEFAFAYKRKFYDELGIELNAIQSPIDFKGGDWATMLSIYCGTAHSEDVKISMRTKDGIHEHLLEGKCANRAPRGYINKRISKHDCWVEVDEPKASRIRQAFMEVAKGIECAAVIRRRICPDIPETSFTEMLKNPFYAGKIRVPAYNNEPEQIVNGVHEPIIDAQTFYKVQDIIGGKKCTNPKVTKSINPDLYLRKYIVCPICGHRLTGAVSKGNGGYYTYYFCSHDHKHINIRAEEVNRSFVNYVSSLKPNKAVLALYNEILLDIRGDKVKENHEQAAKLEKSIQQNQSRIDRVNDLFIDGQLQKAEADKLKERYQKENDKLKYQVKALRLSEDLQIKEKLNYSISLIGNLGKFFDIATPEVKIKLLGSIFPEKIEFDGKNYRTNSINQVLEIIFKETKQLYGNKKSESSKNLENPDSVPRAGVEPAQPLQPLVFETSASTDSAIWASVDCKGIQ